MKKVFEIISTFWLMILGAAGFFAFILREYFNVGYDFSTKSFLILLSLGFIFTAIFIKRSREKKGNEIYDWLILLASTILFIRGLVLPINGWDAYALYDFRGQVYSQGYSQADLVEIGKYDETNRIYLFAYPPMTSVLHAIFYEMGINPMLSYAVFYIGFLVFMYLLFARFKIPKAIKLILFLIAAAHPLILEQTSIAYTNLPALSFQIASLYFLIKYAQERKAVSLIIAATFLAFGSWTRFLEPFPYIFIAAAVYVLALDPKLTIKKKLIFSATFFLIVLLPRFVWMNYLQSVLGSTENFSTNLITAFGTLPQAFFLANTINVVFFVYTSLAPILWYIGLWAIGIVFGVFSKERISLSTIIVGFIAFGILSIMIVATFYSSSIFYWWDKIGGSFLRSNLIFIPLSSLFSASLLNDISGKKSKQR
jgi:hypothetical protein